MNSEQWSKSNEFILLRWHPLMVPVLTYILSFTLLIPSTTYMRFRLLVKQLTWFCFFLYVFTAGKLFDSKATENLTCSNGKLRGVFTILKSKGNIYLKKGYGVSLRCWCWILSFICWCNSTFSLSRGQIHFPELTFELISYF